MIPAVLLPFAVAVVAPLLHRLRPRWTRGVLSLLPAGIAAWLLSVAPDVAAGESLTHSSSWIPALGLDLTLRLDGLGLLFALLIAGIGLLVFVHAGGYLRDRADLGRFYAYLSLFMGSMLGLVMADNLLLLFVFWEATSVASYLLIGFDHRREAARDAARHSLIVTGLGGVALLAGVLLLGSMTGTYELSRLIGSGLVGEAGAVRWWAMGLILVGALSKSAQFPFHFWLPRAMEAPTPASAYLHSSTMVTAGVYLIARLHPLFGGLAGWRLALLTIGGVTAAAGAVIAFRQTVLKRLLAYSTVSALGFTVMMLGLGSTAGAKAALTFLVAHALYKSALFLSVANLTAYTGSKDAEEASAPFRIAPLLAAAGALGAAAMAGLPPTVGFVGKEVVFDGLWHAGPTGPWLALVAAAATAPLVAVAFLVGVRPYTGSAPADPAGAGDGPSASHDLDLATRAAPLILAAAALAAGIWPEPLSRLLVGPATLAVAGAGLTEHLRSWYGFGPALVLDAGAVLGGILAFRYRRAIRGALDGLAPLERWGPASWYQRALDGLTAGARLQTRWLQSGSLHRYVIVVVATAAVLTGAALFAGVPGWDASMSFGPLRPHEAIAALVVASAAVVTMRLDSRLAVLALLGIVGYGVAALFVLFGAPDLATTQILVETLTVILLALAFRYLPRFPLRRRTPWHRLDALVAVAWGAVIVVVLLAASSAGPLRRVSRYLAEASVPAGHGRNIVNVILVDFRALDTFGEILVIAVAAIGAAALLRGGRRVP